MRVLKYRDVTRLTFYGRYDKNINDAASIYAGFDRALTTTTWGGINSLSLTNAGTIGFTSAPSVYVSNESQTNPPIFQSTLSGTSYNINSIAVVTGGTGWTSAPTVIINGTGTGATATATVAAGAITAITMTNTGSGYTAAPTVSFNGGGFINITANIAANIITGFTITNGGTNFASAPTIVIGGSTNVSFQTTTCTITAGVITAIALPPITLPFFIAPIVSIFGGGNVMTSTTSFGYQVNSIIFPSNLIPYGTFVSQPIVSFSGGGVINITAVLTGNAISSFTITNGGYANCFSFPPPIIITGGGGYALTTCTITNGVIVGITIPVAGNYFTSVPTVSVYGGGLPTATITLNPYNIITGAYSPYKNTKRLRFDLNQELQALRLSDNAELYLEYVRMPALSVNSTCFKNLRLIGASNINTFDSIQGSTGNPILFSCESGNVATNYIIASTDYSRLNIPPNFLNKGYIEFEMETILSANTVIFTAAQLNELIIRLVIVEPNNEITQDNNLGPEYTKGRIIHFNHHK